MTVNRDYLNRELKIRYTQYLDRIEREGAFNSTSRSSINEAADRVRCWICMDKKCSVGIRGGGGLLWILEGHMICSVVGGAKMDWIIISGLLVAIGIVLLVQCTVIRMIMLLVMSMRLRE